MKTTSKKICPPPLQEYYLQFFLMTSHLDSHRTTDIKPKMLLGVQTGYRTPHDKYHLRSIAHVRTNRTDNIFMQRRLVQIFTYSLEWGRGTCTLTKQTQRWAYSALRYPLLTSLFYLFEHILYKRLRLRVISLVVF